MPLSNNPQEEIKKLGQINNLTNSWRERMDKDWEKGGRGEEFKMPEEEGEWEEVTSNRLKSEGWKIVNTIARADRQLFILTTEEEDEKTKERQTISYTEMAVNGLLYDVDRIFDATPDMPMLQSQMGFYRTFRGTGTYRLVICEDDDEVPYLDLAVWDARNVYWINGYRRLPWVCYIRYASKQSLEMQYGWNGKGEDKNGMLTVYNIFDCSERGKKAEEGVVIGNDKEWVKREQIKVGGVGLDYLPIRIRAGGPYPMIKDGHDDNIKFLGESYIANNRLLADLESRILTYKMTRAGMEAKMPQIVEFDSSKGTKLPPQFDKDPYVKNRFIPLDKGKGQKMGDPIQMAQGNSIELMRADLHRMENRGGLSEVAYGEYSDVAVTATGTDILSQATREHIWPFISGCEDDFVWIAEEIARQLKMGSFKEIPARGFDYRGNWYNKPISPDKITDEKHFACKLRIDSVRDEATKSAMLMQEVGSGVRSLREGLEHYQLSKDPDRSIKMIEEEMASKMFDKPLFSEFHNALEAFEEDQGNEEKRMYLDHCRQKLALLVLQTEQQLQAMSQPLTGQPAGLMANQTRTARTAQPQMPAETGQEYG